MDLKRQQAVILKSLRQKHNLTQEQLALKSGVSIDAIRQLETSVKLARVDTIFKILRSIDETPAAFYDILWSTWL